MRILNWIFPFLCVLLSCTQTTVPPDWFEPIVAFSREYPNAIYSVSVQGGSINLITQTEQGRTSLCWLDDGNRIAYVDKNAAYPADTTRICVFDLRVSIKSLLFVRIGEQVSQLHASPSGDKIAFVIYPNSTVTQIGVINADGSNERTLTTSATNKSFISWSPQGDALLFIQDGDIWKIQTQDAQLRQLTSTSGRERDPSFSPSGSQIAYCFTDSSKSGLFVMNSDGTGKFAVTPFDSNAYRHGSIWSSQSNYIAFLQQYFAYSGNPAQQHVFVVRADGTDLRQISTGSGPDWNPTWTPDGEKVLYIATTMSPTNLFVSHRAGNNVAQVTFFSDPDSGGVSNFDVIQPGQ